jgi:hypothetical protein
VNTIEISGQRNEGPQQKESQRPEGAGGETRKSAPAGSDRAPRRWGLGVLTAVLAIGLAVALAVIGQLLGDRQGLRDEVASLTSSLDEADASRADTRATIDGVADQLLELHGTLSALAQEAAPAQAGETSDASGASPAQTPPPVPAADEDPDYWHDRALELAR